MVLDVMAPAAERLARARARLANADAILADLDGTLIFGSAPAPGATELLARFEGRSAVVSNYSTVTGIEMSNRLLRMGLSMPPEHIFLAGEVALRELARNHPGSRLLCVMAAPMRQLARDLGFELVEQNPDVVLVGRDLDLTYPRLVAAMQAVHSGARIYATNPDLSHPGEGARPVPETGSLLAAVLAAAPGTEVVMFGKPEPSLFEAGLRAVKSMPLRAVMLGDNPDTDVRGAAALGIPTIQINASSMADAPTLAAVALGI